MESLPITKEELEAKCLTSMKSAVNALNTINKNDVTEIKAYASPPAVCGQVMEMLLVLFEVPFKKTDNKWTISKRHLLTSELLNKLKNYDCANLKPEVAQKV